MVIKYFTILVVLTYLIGVSEASNISPKEQLTAEANTNAKRSHGVEAVPAYGVPANKVIAEPVGAALAVSLGQQYYQSQAPTRYSNSIPAAAIRNVETVAVTKTITPVVTKTTTYTTHSEPALSIGHVQGYSKSAVGQAKVAPVQYVTQYTSYGNPTVGVNGPVTYTGPAVLVGGGYGGGGQVLALAPVHNRGSTYVKGLAPSYGAPYSAPIASYASHASPGNVYVPAKVQVASVPVKTSPSYGAPHVHAYQTPHSHVHAYQAPHSHVHAYQAPHRQFHTYQVPHRQIHSYQVPHRHQSSYGVPKGQHIGSYSMNFLNYMSPPRPEPAPKFHQPQYFYGVRMQQPQQQQYQQPVRTIVETYAGPSITLTKQMPITKV